MSVENIQELIRSSEYSFLWKKPLGDSLILLGYGGSHAYGLNTATSDIDIRGVALNSREEILVGQSFDQVVNTATDTTIYAFNRIVQLLCDCNPNVIELLGLRPEDYLFYNKYGKQLLQNKKLFLSQKAAHSFGGYANAQLHRLNNKASRNVPQSELEEHIMKRVQFAYADAQRSVTTLGQNTISFYVDRSDKDDYDTEIFCDITMRHYPLRDFNGIMNNCCEVVKAYNKIGHRNKHAIEHGKIAKHQCHLVRLYKMGLDILEKEEINTYRTDDHDLLMSIRNGDYLDEFDQPTGDFMDLVRDLEKQFAYAKQNTSLPRHPDMGAINDFVKAINYAVVTGR